MTTGTTGATFLVLSMFVALGCGGNPTPGTGAGGTSGTNDGAGAGGTTTGGHGGNSSAGASGSGGMTGDAGSGCTVPAPVASCVTTGVDNVACSEYYAPLTPTFLMQTCPLTGGTFAAPGCVRGTTLVGCCVIQNPTQSNCFSGNFNAASEMQSCAAQNGTWCPNGH
jgi:hypothetical protein